MLSFDSHKTLPFPMEIWASFIPSFGIGKTEDWLLIWRPRGRLAMLHPIFVNPPRMRGSPVPQGTVVPS